MYGFICPDGRRGLVRLSDADVAFQRVPEEMRFPDDSVPGLEIPDGLLQLLAAGSREPLLDGLSVQVLTDVDDCRILAALGARDLHLHKNTSEGIEK